MTLTESIKEIRPFQAITTVGLGVVIAWFAFDHFRKADAENDKFMREELLKALVENAKASSESASAMKDVAGSMNRVVEEFDDFELRLEAKVIGQRNSGVTVRTNKKRYSYPIEGYEIDMGIKLWGVIFEEGGTRGPVNRDDQEELQPKIDRVVRRGDFNDFVVRCEGNHIKAWLNGVYYDFVETDPQALKKLRSGTIGLQLHSGKPQVVSFRNIRVKELPRVE